MTFVIIFAVLLILLPAISKFIGRKALGSSEEMESFKRSKINFQKNNTPLQEDFFAAKKQDGTDIN